MAQIFHPSTNTFSRVTIFGAVIFLALLLWILAVLYRSSWVTEVGVVREQPVPFSHQHHVAGLGIDCLYCHTSVEDSSFAGIPPTQTCMNCHSQIWADSPMLAPVRDSFRTNRSLRWTRVHDLADFAYFNHEIHVRKGVTCRECHGDVEQMPLMWRVHSLQMEWCLECHRRYERDPAIFPAASHELLSRVVQVPNDAHRGPSVTAHAELSILTSCSTCHR
jgi:hypothetical protein